MPVVSRGAAATHKAKQNRQSAAPSKPQAPGPQAARPQAPGRQPPPLDGPSREGSKRSTRVDRTTSKSSAAHLALPQGASHARIRSGSSSPAASPSSGRPVLEAPRSPLGKPPVLTVDGDTSGTALTVYGDSSSRSVSFHIGDSPSREYAVALPEITDSEEEDSFVDEDETESGLGESEGSSLDTIAYVTEVHRTPMERKQADERERQWRRKQLVPRFREQVLLQYKIKNYKVPDGRYNQTLRASNLQQDDGDRIEGRESISIWVLRKFGLLQNFVEFMTMRMVLLEESQSPELEEIVTSHKFEGFVGIMICLNAITLGLDVQFPPGEAPESLAYVEHFFVAVFATELYLRIKVYSFMWAAEPQNLFDIFLVVVVGVLSSWILPWFIDVPHWLQRLAVLRIFRMVRLIETVRILPAFLELWQLICGIRACLYLLFWSLVVTGMVQYSFAIALMDYVGKNPQFEDNVFVQEWFGSVFDSMFSLFQIMTFDGWADSMRQVYGSPEAAVILIFYVGFSGILIFNLITAIVCEKAFAAADSDYELKATRKLESNKKMENQLVDMFKDMDEDQSGILTKEEFFECIDDVRFLERMKGAGIDVDELPDVWEVLDDGEGVVTTQEFVLGLSRLAGHAQSKDMMLCQKEMANTTRVVQNSSKNFKSAVGTRADLTIKSLKDSQQRINAVLHLTADVLQVIDGLGYRELSTRSMIMRPAKVELPSQVRMEQSERQAEKMRDRVELEDRKANGEYRIVLAEQGRVVPLPPGWARQKIDEKRRENVLKGRSAKALGDIARDGDTESTNSGVAWHPESKWDKMALNIHEICRAASEGQMDETGSGLRLSAAAPLDWSNGTAHLFGQLRLPASRAADATQAANSGDLKAQQADEDAVAAEETKEADAHYLPAAGKIGNYLARGRLRRQRTPPTPAPPDGKAAAPRPRGRPPRLVIVGDGSAALTRNVTLM